MIVKKPQVNESLKPADQRPDTEDGNAVSPALPCATAVVVDQLEFFRLGLVEALGECSIAVIAESTGLAEGIRLATDRSADLLIVGKHPDLKRRISLKAMKRSHSERKVIVLLDRADLADVAKLIDFGVDALLLRSAQRPELREAIQRLLDGERFVAPALAAGSVGRVGPLPIEKATAATAMSQATEPQERIAHNLSARELEVLAELATGATYAQISVDLIISRATVKTHVIHIYDKLGVRTRNEAVARALGLGILG